MGLFPESERGPRSSHFQATYFVEYVSSFPDDICIRVTHWSLCYLVCFPSVVPIPNYFRHVTLFVQQQVPILVHY
jgi:hypothetical protein